MLMSTDAKFIETTKRIYNQEASKRVLENINKKSYDYVYDKNKNNLQDIAITYYGNQITYETLFINIERYAKSLKKYGIDKKDIVTLVMPNIPEVIYIKYALNRIGAISNLIDPRVNPKRILEYANKTNSKMLIASLEIFDTKIKPIIDELRLDNILLVSAANSIEFSSNIKIDLVKLLLEYKAKLLLYKEKNNAKIINSNKFLQQTTSFRDTLFDLEEAFSIYYTSGTTGKSKGVVATNEAYNAMAEEMNIAGLDFRRNESFLGVIPFFSAYGSLNGMHNSLANGWNIILIPKFNPNKFDLLIKKYQPNNALGVPRWWEEILYNHNLDNEDLSFLKRPVTGGDRISKDTINSINEFFDSHGAKNVKLKVGYGASEFGGCVSATCEDYGFYDTSTSGILLPNAKCMVINPKTLEEMPINQSGELCFNTLSMMKEYFKEPEETRKLIIYKNGIKYYRTGDKGYIDENGSIHFIDRYKRAMMRPDGHTVHASPIEDVIMSSKMAESCCVVGLQQVGLSGTIPSAFIKLKNDYTQVEEVIDIIDKLCLENLPERDKALVYIIVKEMKFTNMEKVDYRYYEQLKLEDLDYVIKDYTFFEKDNKRIKKR